MSINRKIVLIQVIEEMFSNYIKDNSFLLDPEWTKELFLQRLKEESFYNLNEKELEVLKDCIEDGHVLSIFQFIFEDLKDQELGISLKDLIIVLSKDSSIYVDRKIYTLNEYIVTNKLYKNIYKEGINSHEQTDSLNSRNENFYILFYNQLKISELIYFYKDSSKVKLFDQILFKFFIPKINGMKFDFSGKETFKVIEESFKILDNYDKNMPLEWFMELKNDEFEEVFKLVLSQRLL